MKECIINAIHALKEKDLDDKPVGWDIGFIIGFVNGNLSQQWHHEYIVKNEEDYKTFAGLKAVQAYLQIDELAEIKINRLYEELMHSKTNLEHIDLELNQSDLDVNNMKIELKPEKGKISTILNNLIMKQIKATVESRVEISLPIGDFFTNSELKSLIDDNRTSVRSL